MILQKEIIYCLGNFLATTEVKGWLTTLFFKAPQTTSL